MLIHPTKKLGRLPKKSDPRTLQLRNYIDQSKGLPQAPSTWGYTIKVSSWPMMLNDNIGDCAIAAPGHMVQLWTTYAASQVIISDSDIQKAYSAVSGYVPGEPNTDVGCNMLDVLQYWKGAGIGGHKILGWVEIQPTDWNTLNVGGWLFGSLFAGLNLPWTASSQIDAGHAWDVTDVRLRGNSAPGSWGGHAVPLVARVPNMIWCPTWTIMQGMTHRFWNAYGDELYAVLSQDWISILTQLAPSGFNIAQLQADLAAL